jgi:RsiW-degrading membrane proteinase PrsW (M82 family)
MLLYLVLGLCALAMAATVYRYDLYDREPPLAMLTVVALGAAMMHLAGIAQVAFMSALGSRAAAAWNLTMALSAGFSEEMAKVLCVLAIAIAGRRWFNDPIDGLIYGSLAGLGAAIEESVVLLMASRPHEFLPAGEPVRLAGHLVMGGISAFGIGALARASSRPPRWSIAACLFIGAVLHTAWDIVAFSAADHGKMLGWHVAASMALMIAGFAVYRGLVGVGSRLSKRVFSPTSSATS